MGVGMRHFVVDGEELRPLPERTLTGLREGAVRLPRYAGQELHVVDVTVELRDRTPVAVREVAGRVLPLDEHGRMKSQLLDQLRASLRKTKLKGWQPSEAQIARARELALGKVKAKRRPPAIVREGGQKERAPASPKSEAGAGSKSRASSRARKSGNQRGYHAAPPRAIRHRKVD
jgi:hypothetical protein